MCFGKVSRAFLEIFCLGVWFYYRIGLRDLGFNEVFLTYLFFGVGSV